MIKLNLDQIRANPWNCNFLSPQERANLKQRMREDGPEKTLPVVVRKIAENYELVDGEQRWELAGELGWIAINAIEREANDLQTRALCVSYNRWRGRLNWFKLYDVIKKDLESGIDIYESYRGALSNKEIEYVLSLGNLISEARQVLEESLKKYTEITLEQLHLLSLFPASQQESLVEKFKTPVVIQALLQALNPFLSKNQPQSLVKKSFEKTQDQDIRCTPERAAKAIFPKDLPLHRSDFSKEIDSDKALTFSQTKAYNKCGQNKQADSQAIESGMTQKFERRNEAQQALLIEVSYDCDCGRHYRVNFKNLSVVMQKENMLFEHADVKPRTFQAHCDKCNSEHEFTVDGVENETKQVLCRRCKPLPRQGVLDVNTGEVTWLD